MNRAIQQIKYWVNQSIQWDRLARFGNNPIIKRTYFWLFFTPAAVKFAVIIERWYLDQFGNSISLELPFSWYVFFLSALFFTLGAAVFQSRCPKIVRDYGNFSKFQSIRKPSYRVWDLKFDLSRTAQATLDDNYGVGSYSEDDEFMPVRTSFTSKEKSVPRDTLTGIYDSPIAIGESSQPHAPAQVFDNILEEANKDYIGWRLACGIFFTIGFLLFVLLVLQNIKFVIYHMLELNI